MDVLKSKFIMIYTCLLFMMSMSVFNLEDNYTKGLLSLFNLILLTIPLVSIMYSTSYIYNSSEFVELLLSQPVKRSKIWISLFIGLVLAFVFAFMIGMGLPILMYAFSSVGIMMLITGLMISIIFVSLALFCSILMRDKAKGKFAWFSYGVLSLGWRGSAEHWHHYEKLYLLLAGLATPLVVSVHTVVSFDFAVAIVPGWHSTIFPPYFVAGAIFSGFAMVLSLAIPIRSAFGLQDFITLRHLDNMAKILLATGLIVTYSYLFELFFAFYSGNIFERYVQINRMIGNYSVMYWILILGNVVAPQLMWFKRFRTSVPILFILSLVVNVGMWTERYVIVVTSLHRDYMPSAWGMYSGTWWDYATLAGTIGLFVALMFLFVRLLPAISMAEMRKAIAPADVKEAD